jgi:hypothetical protein
MSSKCDLILMVNHTLSNIGTKRSNSYVCQEIKYVFSKCMDKTYATQDKINEINEIVKKYCSDEFGFRCSDR